MNSASNNILFLVPGFPSDENDTACIPALQLYTHYFRENSDGCGLTVITFQYPYGKGKYYWKNIPVYSAGGIDRGGIFRLLTWLRAGLIFIKLYRIKKFSGIHSFWMNECALVGFYLSRLFGIPHVVTLMGQDVKSSNKYLKYLPIKNLKTVSPSGFASETFYKSTSRKPDEIIPFGIDENHLAENNNKRIIDIIGVGSLTGLKNYELFIDIIDTLKNTFPGIKSVIVGEGPQRKFLEQIIQSKNLSNNIELKGKLPRNEVLRYMSMSKIFLHTSIFESQGYVFLEALKCGLYVVCRNVGYLPSSKIFTAGNTNEMREKIIPLLNCGLDHSSQTPFTMRETVEKYKVIYNDLGIIG